MSEVAAAKVLDWIAGNFRWVWDEPSQRLFRTVDRAEWDRTGDPFTTLSAVSVERWAQLDADEEFRARLDEVRAGLGAYLREAPSSPTVAYFCMEHGIAPPLRTYAGGLGLLAGCIEKTASDLGVPMVAIGLLYRWWFRQRLSFGWQQEDWQHLDPHKCGLELCAQIRVSVAMADDLVTIQVWRARVGRVDLYLLDTDVPDNPPHLRGITDRLYGGDHEHRLRQEMVLGVGGVRALEALGLAPTVYHANEGHAGFLGLERVRRALAAGVPLDQAVARVRARTVFTTHTAMPAGFDLFDRRLMERYFSGWAAECGVTLDWLMSLGHFPGQRPDEPFNMAVLCARLSGQVNAVSRLHREITEERVLGPLWPDHAAPVRTVTNGVHPRTWTPPATSALFDRYVGRGWEYAGPDDWDRVWNIPAEELWTARQRLRSGLVEWLREYLPRRLAAQGWVDDLSWAHHVLDPQGLTVVIARRATEYKETDLLVSLPQRLRSLTSSPDRPVNVIFAGNAHPSDHGGKERIRRIVEFSLAADVRSRVLFVPGYDMHLARVLLAGADVWLNHPRRGDEACGTSFMKSVYAGGRIMTTADGGADELIVDGDNGWIIGDRRLGAPREVIATRAFDLLEDVLVPEFYDRDDDGLPHRWIAGMKRSLASLGWQVSSGRMMRAYQRLYRAAARD